MKNMHQAIYELLKDKKRGYLLDAACGKGELGGALEKAGHQVFYMDKYDNPHSVQRFVNADLNDYSSAFIQGPFAFLKQVDNCYHNIVNRFLMLRNIITS